MRVYKPTQLLLDSLWRLVDSHKDDSECVEFNYNLTLGYPVIARMKVHRLILERKLGRSIEVGKWALHKCGNRKCINPNHIYEGTPFDNNQDTLTHRRWTNKKRNSCPKCGKEWNFVACDNCGHTK